MSFLAGRLAGKEGAYFFQESKKAVGRLASQKSPTQNKLPSSSSAATELGSQADVLPEVLRHSLPPKIFHQDPEKESSFDTASKWVLKSDHKVEYRSLASQAHSPIRGFLSLPPVTFGPTRWKVPEWDDSIPPSTANELREQRNPTPLSPEKAKAMAEGIKRIALAFAAATVLVFGGAAVLIGMVISKLQVKDTDDFRIKVKDILDPRFEEIRERCAPLKAWFATMSKKWHWEKKKDVKEKPFIKALIKTWGLKRSD